MIGLLELKEKLKNFYSEHDVFLKPILKFLVIFISLILIKYNIGYMEQVNMWPVIFIVAVVLAFLPWTVGAVLLLVMIMINLYAVSAELAALVAVVMVIMLLFFFKFTPKEGVFLIMIPMAFFIKIPYLVPIAVGLTCTPVSIVSVVFGTVIYFMILVISENAMAISNITGESTSATSINSIINMISNNKEMFITIAAFVVTIIVVYNIKRLKIDNAWTIAILVGGAVDFIIILIGTFILNTETSMIGLIVGSVVSIFLAYILQFFVFSLDYSRTEHTQFEDDEYYYYVKAVPKINVTAPEMNVKRINAQRRRKASTKRSGNKK